MNCYICGSYDNMKKNGKVNEIIPKHGVPVLICFICANKFNKIKNKDRKTWEEVIKEVKGEGK